jgi:energy-coupling factor transporter ATP-binding protein EcfA2
MQYKDSDIRGCYFLSLKVENIACFGNPQILDLSSNGQPARWTVIIGDNGAGKTTLLRCLAGIAPYSTNDPDSMTFLNPALNWRFKREDQLQPAVEAHFAIDWKFTANKKEFPTVN